MFEDSRQRSILLVEDEPDLANMVGDYLREHGFYVEVQARGDTAPERIVTSQPDVVILDVNLPGLNGFEICRLVRDRYPGVILMLTARGPTRIELAWFSSRMAVDCARWRAVSEQKPRQSVPACWRRFGGSSDVLSRFDPSTN